MFMPGNHQWIYTGFVQGLEFLKMSLKFAKQFSRPGKSL